VTIVTCLFIVQKIKFKSKKRNQIKENKLNSIKIKIKYKGSSILWHILYDIIIWESYLYHIYNYNMYNQPMTAIISYNCYNYYYYKLKILK